MAYYLSYWPKWNRWSQRSPISVKVLLKACDCDIGLLFQSHGALNMKAMLALAKRLVAPSYFCIPQTPPNVVICSSSRCWRFSRRSVSMMSFTFSCLGSHFSMTPLPSSSTIWWRHSTTCQQYLRPRSVSVNPLQDEHHYWNENFILLAKFSSLAAMNVVKWQLPVQPLMTSHQNNNM